MAPTLSCAAAEQAWNERALEHPVRVPAWRLWHYRQPAVVLGCSQRHGLQAQAGRGDLEVRVRQSGGGAVLVGPWLLGLSAALPATHALVAGGPVASYRWLGLALARALRRMGVAAEAVSPQALQGQQQGHGQVSTAGLEWACFGGLSPWEVQARGRKIAGLAQRRGRQGVLLVAGVLLAPPPWRLLCERLRQPSADAQRLARACTDCAQEASTAARPPAAALEVALRAELALALEGAVEPEFAPALHAASTAC